MEDEQSPTRSNELRQSCVLPAAARFGIVRKPGTRTKSLPSALPSTIVLLVLTLASEPMAVAWSRPAEPTFAPSPIMVLLLPVVLLLPALNPTKVLFAPVVF